MTIYEFEGKSLQAMLIFRRSGFKSVARVTPYDPGVPR